MLSSLPLSSLFPYTTLFRSILVYASISRCQSPHFPLFLHYSLRPSLNLTSFYLCSELLRHQDPVHHRRDRKSTRLNSSHVSISYAVFCLKKKTNKPSIIFVS